jgi:hypothetical protein
MIYNVRESLTNQERRNRYRQLRDLGVHWSWALAARDYTHPHFEAFLERARNNDSKNGKEPKPKVS